MEEKQHEGLPVKGYRPQSGMAVQAVNHNKELEEIMLRLLDGWKGQQNIDQRWLAIGRTHLEEGFMAINRAIFQPGRVSLPTDTKPGSEYEVKPARTAAQQEILDGTPPLPSAGENVRIDEPAKQSDIVA